MSDRSLLEGGSFPDRHVFAQEAQLGLYMGKVVRRDDPERRGRVKVKIQNLLSETRWAEPLGMPGAGGPPGGGFFVPEHGAQVAVGFFMGDTNAPYYFTGPPAVAEAPRAAEGQTLGDTPKVRAFETNTFEVFITDTDSEKKLVIRTKSSTSGATENNEIEIDANDGSVQIQASHFLILKAPRIGIDGAVMTLGQRVVKNVGMPI